MLSLYSEDPDSTVKANLSIVYFHRATSYYQEKQFGSAFASYQKAADYNHVEAIGSLANFYYDGIEPVKKNLNKAIELYDKAAGLGHSISQLRAGLMYFKGEGTDRKYDKALQWLLAAQKENHNEAIKIIGEIYYEGGHGVEKDYEQALYWFLKSAQDIECQEKIALIYRQGHGNFKADWKKARLWYTNSATAGNPNSQYDLGSFYLRGDLDIPIDVLKSIKWFTMAFQQGDIKSMVCLGIIFLYGFNEAIKDRSKAYYYFNAALEKDKNDAQANFYMGEFYAQDSTPEYSKAIHHYLIAANARDGEAANALGNVYELGRGVDVDYNKAIEWYTMAVSLGCEDAEENLARAQLNYNQIKKANKAVDAEGSPQPTKVIAEEQQHSESSLQKEVEALKKKLEKSEKKVSKLTKDLEDKNQEIGKKDSELAEKIQIIAEKDKQIALLNTEKMQLQKYQMQLVLDMTSQNVSDKKRRIG